MKTSSEPAPQPRIPLSRRQLWREARVRLVPLIVFMTGVTTLAVLWNRNVAAPTMIGQAEPLLANLSSQQPGVLTELKVTRFQRVKAGELLGRVQVANPGVLESSLAVIRGELDGLRANMQPIVAQQRTAMDYAQLRLDWMRQRAALASAKVNLQLAEVELRRAEELYNSKITAQSELDIAKANCGALQQQVEELTALVADCERSFGGMRPEGAADIAQISSEPMRAAIAVQESKLRLTEAELSPLLLRAPMDGLVTAVFHHAGEAVVAGQPIVAIAADKADRIVGYLRHPVSAEPQPGALAEIRTRGGRRVSAKAHVVQIGAQLEPLPVALQSSVKLFGPDLGLPVDISLPVNLVLRPGELVDITILPVAN